VSPVISGARESVARRLAVMASIVATGNLVGCEPLGESLVSVPKTTLQGFYRLVTDAQDGTVHLIAAKDADRWADARRDCLATAKKLTEIASIRGDGFHADEAAAVTALRQEITRLDSVREGQRTSPPTSVDWINGEQGATSAPRSPNGKSYAKLFPNVQLSCGPFESRDDFWRSFLQRDRVADSRWSGLEAVQNTLVDSEGGVAMPTEVAAAVADVALEESIVMSRADIIPMQSEKKRVWAFDGSSVSGGTLYGNASAQWTPEGGTATVVTLEAKKIELTARKLFLLVEESREISESGVGFSTELETTIGRALGWHADDAFLHGDGVGKPQGALTSANPARILVTRAGANLIASADILSMAERLHPALFNESIWITSNPCLDQLTGAHVAGSNSDNFLFAPSQGEGLPNTLLGRPIILSEKSPNLGTEADLALVAFSGYAVGIRQGIQIDSSMHVGFTRDTLTLRGLMRTDGQSKWISTFQPKDSNSATLSWAVVLAA